MVKTITALLSVLFGLTFSAAQRHPKEDACFEKLKTAGSAKALRGICEHVITPDLVDDELSYITRFKKAAGVTSKDSEEEMHRKIREVWNKYEDCLICDAIAFSVRGGNILKPATVSRNKEFYNTILKWGVNLNRIDPVDGRTVLDYFRDKMSKNPPNVEFYRAYYSVLKEYGAKHAADILAQQEK